MRARCRNPRHPQWENYGGRGISICERWNTFSNFAADMGPKPSGALSIDRIDVNGNYEPGNCRWATQKQQLRNTRSTRRITVEGIEYVAIDLAEKCGLKTDTIIKRASYGLSLKEVLDPRRRVFLAGLALGGAANGKRIKAKRYCKNGHKFLKTNTYITKEGWRRCRKCRAIKARLDRHH